MDNTEKLLKALANRRRLAIVHLLDHGRTATVGDIARTIKLSFKATSKHLGILRAADVVEREQVNLNMIYRLSRPVHQILKSALNVL